MQARSSLAARRLVLPLQGFVHAQEVGGLVMMMAAAVALLWTNSAWNSSYDALFSLDLSIGLGGHRVSLDLRALISEGLMALFFLAVGMEIKRELLEGELRGARRAALPAAAALGGMVVPGLVYLAIAGTEAPSGWAIPIATDIAFALAVLYLLGDRVGPPLKALLLGVAILDDLASILVIAFFYTERLHLQALGAGVVLVGLMAVLHRLGVRSVVIHTFLGLAVWVAAHESGVHATLAGVALAAVMPIRARFPRAVFRQELDPLVSDFERGLEEGDLDIADATLGRIESLVLDTESRLDRVLRKLSPLVAVTVLPLFALASAAVEVTLDSVARLAASPVALGVAAGLLLGKPLGFFGASWLALRLGWARLPAGIRLREIAGVSLLAGIGFTISLFVTDLAFSDAERIADARLAVLSSSLLAGLVGAVVLGWSLRSSPSR